MDNVTPNTTDSSATPDAQAPATEHHPHALAWKAQADADLARGAMTPEQYAGVMADLGFSPEAPAAAAPSETDAYLESIGFPRAKESELRIRQHIAPGQEENLSPEQRADESTITGWLTESRLPAGIANALVDTVAKGAPAWQKMNDGERELSAESARSHLTKMWGDKARRTYRTRASPGP